MTLIDPSSGAGLAFGAVLSSSQVTTVWTQQPDAVDGVGGGSYAGTISFTGALTIADTDVDGVLEMNDAASGIGYRTATLGDADANLSIAIDEYRFTVVPTAARTLTLLDTTGGVPTDGQRIRVIQTIGGGGGGAGVTFIRETGSTTIATITAANIGMVEFTFHVAGNGWYVSSAQAGVSITSHT